MEYIKASFITTVLNEEKTIQNFLDSLFSQSVMPEEIVIVDANSKDQTIPIIQKYFSLNTHILTKLLIKPGNRSIGRNEGIKQAKYEIILCSDAGCVLDTQWVKQMLLPFKKESVSVVAGFYKPLTTTVFEQCLATYTCTMEDQVAELSFLPSSRSIAFRKSAWKTVNGYPEHLDTCEDLVFDKKLKNAGFQFFFAKHAVVFWPQRHTFFQAFSQFFHYALGDGNALYFRPQTPLLFIRYFVFIVILSFYISQPFLLSYIFLSLGILYFLWAIGKNYKYIEDWHAIYILPLLQITADFAVLWGTTAGVLENYFRNIKMYRKKIIRK